MKHPTRSPSTLQFALICAALWLASDAVVAAGQGDGIIDPGENETAELARAVQNPVASLISVPFQNNTNFEWGPEEETLNTLNIQPVIPLELNSDWNLITRTIVPVVSQPAISSGGDRKTGLGDTTFTAFLAPRDFGKMIWGAGPVILLPTATDDRLGSDQWGLGPSFVALTMRGPWVLGSLFSNVWSVGGSGDEDVNVFTWQYFVNYNLRDGWYLTSSPIITANWEASSDEWTFPVGGGAGRVFKVGAQPMNVGAQAYYHLVKPGFVGDWSLRLQIQFMFPK